MRLLSHVGCEIVALYRYLTGTQGRPPSPYFDPLRQLIALAHSRGIQVHAWLNPYRANLAPNWHGLAPNHIANVYRLFAHPYDQFLWMDPGAVVVEDWLMAVVEDIITRSDFMQLYSTSKGAITSKIKHTNKSCRTCTTVAALISILF